MIRRALPLPPLLFAGYAVAALLLFRGAFLGDRSWFDFGDASLQSWPWLLAVAHGARYLHPVLWEFGSQAGTSLAGELQPGPFYPPTWLLGLLGLDGLPLCNSYVLLHFALAATGMHLLLRAERLSPPASVLGAALFAFAGYLPFQANAQPNIFASLCWLPLVLLGARRAFAAPGRAEAIGFAALAGLAGGLQIAAGHLQPFVHGSYAVMLCALAAAIAARSARPLLLGLFAQAMALGFAAVPLWLANQYLHLVYRWYATGMSRWPHAVPWPAYAQGAALRWSDLPAALHRSTLAEMDGSLYLTTAALPLLAIGLLRRGVFARSMLLVLLFGLLAALGGHLQPAARLFFHLPLLSQLRTPIRAVYLVGFAAAALAAIGFDAMRAALAAGLGPLHGRRIAGALAAVLGCGIATQLVLFDRGVGRPRDNPEFAPLYYGRNPALDAVVRLANQGPLVDRIDAQPRDLVPPNAGDVAPVLNVMGQRATMLVPLFDTLAQGWGPGVSAPLDRLGVRWVVSDHAIDGLALRASGPGYRIYERPGSLSVFWMIGPDRVPGRAPVRDAAWGFDTVTIRLSPPGAPTRLVFAQPWYPGWTARIDGRPAPLTREGLFAAVDLPAGAGTVSFVYRPALWLPGGVTVATAAILAAAWIAAARARRKSGKAQRLENWNDRRALALPYFLRSTTRLSRVRKPATFRMPRRPGS